MKNAALALSLLLSLPFVACSTSSPTGDAISGDGSVSSIEAMEQDDDSTVTDADDVTAQDDASTTTVTDAGADARIIPVTVTDRSFSPETITVKQGEKVKLELKGDDGVHSLLVANLGLNVRVEPGTDVLVDLPTTTPGTYEGRCGVPWGPGHRDMKFTIVVE